MLTSRNGLQGLTTLIEDLDELLADIPGTETPLMAITLDNRGLQGVLLAGDDRVDDSKGLPFTDWGRMGAITSADQLLGLAMISIPRDMLPESKVQRDATKRMEKIRALVKDVNARIADLPKTKVPVCRLYVTYGCNQLPHYSHNELFLPERYAKRIDTYRAHMEAGCYVVLDLATVTEDALDKAMKDLRKQSVPGPAMLALSRALSGSELNRRDADMLHRYLPAITAQAAFITES